MTVLTYYLISVVLTLIFLIIWDKTSVEIPRYNPLALLVVAGVSLIPFFNNIAATCLLWDILGKLPQLLYAKFINDVKEKLKEE